ncbi:MAG: SpoIID/LytB domain-containing protein [Bryobacteraceae bacterium]
MHVLKLLHPTLLKIESAGPARIDVATPQRIFALEGSRSVQIDASRTPVTVVAASGKAARFTLIIPGVIQRTYEGSLHITAEGDLLIPVVTMTHETAVSSITGAEIPQSGSQFAALAAQAIVARSFVSAAGKRHAEADFCDTTHCQFLRSPAVPGSTVALAVGQTEGLVLTANGLTVAARYSAACGGHTDAGEESGYLYQRVRCEVCLHQNTPRAGHGHGLCQLGAIGFGHAGWAYQKILEKYFPGAQIARVLDRV